MKLYEIVNAGTSLRKLFVQDLSLKTSYRLSLLVDALNPHLAYFDSNHERIAKLADDRDKQLDELLQEEVELTVNKVRVSIEEAARLSVADIQTLKEFIDFYEENADDEGGGGE